LIGPFLFHFISNVKGLERITEDMKKEQECEALLSIRVVQT